MEVGVALIYVSNSGSLACPCRLLTALLAMRGVNVGNFQGLCACFPTSLGDRMCPRTQ